MHSSADYTVTPRPMYLADGRKLPDIYTQPLGLREELNQRLGEFPCFASGAGSRHRIESVDQGLCALYL